MRIPRSLTLIATLIFAALAGAISMVRAAEPPVVLSPKLETAAVAKHIRVLEDPRGELSFDDIQQRGDQFRAAADASERGVNFGYSRSVWWIKLDLQRTPDTPLNWMLELAFPQLDRVDFFGPNGERYAVGDTFPAALRPLWHRHFVFPLRFLRTLPETVAGGDVMANDIAPHSVYLRIASEGILVVPLTLWQEAAFYRNTQITYLLLTVLSGSILMLGVFSLILFRSFGDRANLNFSLFAFSVAFAQFVVNGFGAEMLWPSFPEWGNISPLFAASLCGCFGLLFVRRFLDTSRLAPLFDGAILAFAALFATGLLTAFFLSAPLVSLQISFVATGGLTVSLLAAIRLAFRGNARARWFLLACLPLFVAVLATILRNLNLLPVSFFTLYGVRIAMVLHAFILSLALAKRIGDTVIERDFLRSEVSQAQNKLHETLHRAEKVLERRVAERTEALEQANARLRESERQLKDAAQSDTITGVANRLLLDIHTQHAIKTARRDESVFAVLLIDLDHFRPINDTYGHAIGDDVLRVVAQRLRETVREMDTVARLGGDEFVVVLHSIGGHSDVSAVASKIISVVAEPIKVLGVPVDIGVSIGIAMFEPGIASLSDLLRRADTALYQAKQAGGAQYCFFARPPVRTTPEPATNRGTRAA